MHSHTATVHHSETSPAPCQRTSLGSPRQGCATRPLGHVRLIPCPAQAPAHFLACPQVWGLPMAPQLCPGLPSPVLRTAHAYGLVEATLFTRRDHMLNKETSATKVPVTAGFCALFTGQNISTTFSIDFFVKQIHLTFLMGTHGAQVTKAKVEWLELCLPRTWLGGDSPTATVQEHPSALGHRRTCFRAA